MDAKEYNRAMGARLQAAIERRGLNQTTAARALGWNPSRICDYCRGARSIGLDVLDEMIKTLDLDVLILFPEWTDRVLTDVRVFINRTVERSRSIREDLVGIGR